MFKQFILLVVTSLATLVFWLVIKQLMEGSFPTSWRMEEVSIWFWSLILLVSLAGLLALSLLLLDSRTVWLTLVMNLLLFAVIFNPKEIMVWGGAAVALFFQFSAWQLIRREGKNRLRLDLKSMIRLGVGRLITSILILISFAYFLSNGVQEAAQKRELPKVVRETVQIVVGGYIGENLEVKNPSASLRAQATETVLKQITLFLNPYFIYLPPVLAFSLFLALQGLSAIFIWLAIILALLVFWVLKLLKLVKIERELKEAEVINF